MRTVMMPAEVIDLVSSPVAPPITQINPAKHSKPVSYSTAISGSVTIELSDGDEDDDKRLPPAPRLSVSEAIQNPTRNSAEKLVSLLSDDSIGETESAEARLSTTRSDVIASAWDICSTRTVGSSIKGLASNVNLDMLDDLSSSDGPAPKRARVSPELSRLIPQPSGYMRCSSNMESGGLDSTARGGHRPLKRSSTLGDVPESDPIIATSSPDPFMDAARKKKKKKQRLKAREDADPDDFLELDDLPARMIRRCGANDVHPDTGSDSEDLPSVLHLIAKVRAVSPKARPTKAVCDKRHALIEKEKTAAEKARKAQAREAEKSLKLQEKEEAKERKRLEKEKEAQDKKIQSEIAKLNNLKTDKKASSPEMIVDFPSSMDPALVGIARGLLDPLSIAHSNWPCEDPVVKWRRKVEAAWNEENMQFEPVPRHIKTERHILYYLTATKFVELVTSGEGSNLDAHVSRLKSQYVDCSIVYLIEGLLAWQRKNRNLKNRQFEEAVRSHAPELARPSASQGAKRKRKAAIYVDDDLIEDALLRLQIVHQVLIHHTSMVSESAEWLLAFTQHISTIPYKQQRANASAFCMDSGQIKAGDTPGDVYVKMLQTMTRVTEPIAYGIAAQYPTVHELATGLRDEGQGALEDVRKGSNRDGALSNGRVGKAVSRRLYRLFLGRDGGVLDI